MHLELDIHPHVAARLIESARSQGLEPATILENLVSEYLPPEAPPAKAPRFPPTGRAAARLRARLAAEATDDPEIIRLAQESLDEMKRSMNAGRERSGALKIF